VFETWDNLDPGWIVGFVLLDFSGFSKLGDKVKGCLLQPLLKGLSLTLSAYLG